MNDQIIIVGYSNSPDFISAKGGSFVYAVDFNGQYQWGRALTSSSRANQIKNCEIKNNTILIELQYKLGITVIEMDAKDGNFYQLDMVGLNT